MKRTGLVLGALLAAGCSQQLAGDGQCTRQPVHELVAKETDSRLQKLVPADGRVDVLWIGGASQLQLSSFAADSLAEQRTVSVGAEVTKADAVLLNGAVAVAWTTRTPAPALHLSLVRDGMLSVDTVIAADDALELGVGVTSAGRLVVLWSRSALTGGGYELAYTSSIDGRTLDPVVMLARHMGQGVSLVTIPDGLAIGWAGLSQSPSRSGLFYARLDGAAQVAVQATELTAHDKYVYDVALAWTGERLGVATTDSRADILHVPLYFTSIKTDGTDHVADLRLTGSGEHESLDLSWIGASFGLAYVEFGGTGAQLWLLPLDSRGAKLVDPLQVSEASYKEYGFHTRVADPRIVTEREGQVLVGWSELTAAASGDGVYAIKAARLSCRGK